MKRNELKTEYAAGGKRSFARTLLIVFLCVLLVATLTGTVVRVKLTNVSEETVFGEVETRLIDEVQTLVPSDSILYETFTESERVNILCLGVNTGMTDVIMVCSYDIKQQDIALISIPRDTYYYREGYTAPAYFKLNSVYHTSGQNAKGENKDVVATATAVSEILQGMPIHYYAVISYESVENIVNAMGGVPITVAQDMEYTDLNDTPPLVIDIKAGYQVLDGENAVKYLRYRSGYVNGDLGRIEAQQTFMKAAFKQLLKCDLTKIARVVCDNVESDITWGLVSKIIGSITKLSADSIETYVMPNTPWEVSPWYVDPNPEEITEMIKTIYSVSEDTASETTSETTE